MIHIKKRPIDRNEKNKAKHAILDIDDKCGVCGCINNITDISDFSLAINTKDDALSMYYECPNCGSRQFLSIRNACKLRKHMTAIDLHMPDLLVLQRKCELAINDRTYLFDAVAYAHEKHLAVPDEVYFKNEIYEKEVVHILRLLETGDIKTRADYDKHKLTLDYVFSMNYPGDFTIRTIASDIGTGVTEYEIKLGDTVTILNVGRDSHVIAWNVDKKE